MKVIDSSAIIKYVTKEEKWQEVEGHIKEGCVTLDLAIKETANALVKKMLKREVDIETAKAVLTSLSKIVKILPQHEHFLQALEIAIKYKLAIYDALFIALSINTKKPLLTSDRKQAEISNECGVTAMLV